MKVIALRDKVSQKFEGITLAINEFVAKRDFAFQINNSKELLFKAKDLELYVIGDLDQESGIIDVVSPLIRVCSGDEVIGYE